MKPEETMQSLMEIATKRFTDIGVTLSKRQEEVVYFSVLGILAREGFDKALSYVSTAPLSV